MARLDSAGKLIYLSPASMWRMLCIHTVDTFCRPTNKFGDSFLCRAVKNVDQTSKLEVYKKDKIKIYIKFIYFSSPKLGPVTFYQFSYIIVIDSQMC